MGWMKVKVAARYTGVSERTMRTWLKQGLPHSRMPSGSILISQENIDRFLHSFEVEHNQVEEIVQSLIKEMRNEDKTYDRRIHNPGK
jgi:excisionase family DNA binding protein